MGTPKSVRRNVILPLYIDKVNNYPVLDGYTWEELAQGYYGDYRSLPCPQCGDSRSWVDDKCSADGELYPTVERALKAFPRSALIKLIENLCIKRSA